jgi:transcription factor AP-1
MMEVTMYTEDRSFEQKTGFMKTSMNLDLTNLKPKRNVNEIVDSNILKLSSPDLEHLLLSNGLVTTPTPTQFFYPRNVTEEQEAYARGFVEALGQLHKSQGEPMLVDGSIASQQQQQQLSTINAIEILPQPSGSNRNLNIVPQQYVFSTTTSLPGSIVTSNSLPIIVDHMNVTNASMPPQYTTLSNRPMLVRLKEEPQMVPSMSPSPSVQPINMEEQELIKIDRKRARNRIAARKCRQRKLDHIATLEEKLHELKTDRDRLQNTAKSLKDQVEQLRQQVLRHKEKGCDILVSNYIR